MARRSKKLASKRDVDWYQDRLKGINNPNFSGGKYIDDKGYVRVLRPEHPRDICGYVYEHRLVMEKNLGRYLESWETVHHINEIKEDNRLENLYLCTAAEHTAVHSEGRHISWNHKDKLRTMATKRAAKKRKEGTVRRDLSRGGFKKRSGLYGNIPRNGV
ncbi:MAG: HNH endonuclease [Anaerolineales bacterium]|nr:HNH endonuclease [Anaerolineales bacterium]